MPSTSANFNGIGENACNCVPPDPSGAAGPSQYVEVTNTDLAVYSKTGTALLGPEATNTLWSGFGGGCEKNNNGDGTVLFDTINQRWVVQQFSVSTTPYLDCVAVSSTSDATGTWHRYSFEYSKFPDYPKMGVWPDAYYASFNLFNLSPEKFEGTEACAFNRAKMLNGEAASQQCFVGSSTGGKSLLPATLDGTTAPPSGEPEWFVALSPTTANALAYWKFHVDWSNPANTTFTGPTNLPVNAFSQACEGGACIPQAETTNRLDSLGDRLMYRLAYRNFGGHESMVVSHAVTSGSSVGMRWYELRPSSGSLTVYQQGTYAPDSTYRWMGSIAMDKAGDMALGYSTSSSTLHPQIRYTGRLVGDSLGTMPQGEAILYEGPGSQTSYARWGDYTEMSVDPSDECTFWYVNEYLPSNGSFNWHTRIGSFKFPSCSGAPSATTEPATSVTKVGATLNGTVNPEGSETKYHFEYDTKEYKQGEEPHGTKSTETSAGLGTSNVKESAAITGLAAGTTYHFRIVASNSHGTTDGSDRTFTTSSPAWSVQEPPQPTGALKNRLQGVSCTSATSCTAVGYFVNSSKMVVPLAEIWNGTAWSVQEPPSPTGALEGEIWGTNLEDVSCSSTAACTAVGYFVNSSNKIVPLAEIWNGTAWSVQEPPSPEGAKEGRLYSVSCTSSTACIAVGDFISSSGAGMPLAESWDGTAWSLHEPPLPTGSTGADLTGVSCTSSTVCTAVGSFRNSAFVVVALAESWNGTAWSDQEPPSPAGAKEIQPNAGSCSSSTACTAVGYFVNSSGKFVPLAESWNGTVWAAQEPPFPTGASFSESLGVSCASSTACMAVGAYESVTSKTLADYWNGTVWSLQTPPNPSGAQSNWLLGVSCASSTACTAVGFFMNSAGKEVPLAEFYQ